KQEYIVFRNIRVIKMNLYELGIYYYRGDKKILFTTTIKSNKKLSELWREIKKIPVLKHRYKEYYLELIRD
ncbi:MAG: hypothetical protein QXU98_14020, partial [Candidatus Parvarchaeota archaeon]